MLTKGKLLFFGMIFIAMFGFFTRTFYIALFICFVILSIYVLYKIYTRNNPYKKKISIAQDFLKHKYGEKMGNYVLKESINKTKRKKYCFMLFCLLGFVLFFGVMSVSVSAWDIIDWDDYELDSTNGIGDFYSWATTEGDDGNIVLYSLNDSTKSLFQSWVYSSDLPDTTIIDLDYLGDMVIHGFKFYAGYDDVRNTDLGNILYNRINFLLDDMIQLSIRSLYYYDTPNRVLTFQFLDSNATWNTIYSRSQPTAMDGKLCWYINYSTESPYGDIFNVKLYNEDLTVKHGEFNKTMAIWQGKFTYIDEIHIITDGYRERNAPEGDFYIGEISFNQTGYVVAENGYADLYLKLYDLESGELLHAYGRNRVGSFYPPFVKTRIYSDLWSGDYSPTSDFGTTITFADLDLSWEGEWHYFNFTNSWGIVVLDNIIYKDSINYLKVYPEQTLSIYLSDVVTGTSGYLNCKSQTWSNLKSELCTDKKFYTEGESINFRYKAPTEQSLYNVWWLPSSHYYLWIYDTDNLGWLFGNTDSGLSADNWDYIDNYAISLDNTYHTLRWDYNATGESGYKTVTGGRDTYKAYIGHGGGGLFGVDSILVGKLQFHITTGVFTPHGNITTISPESPELGQRTQITFEVNNNGYITSRNLLSPSETELTVTTFAKFTGLTHINYTFWDYGEYLLTLYVSDGLGYTSVDTQNLSVKTLNNTYGGFGYNVEFLTVEPARAIAGFDTVHVNYRSLSADGYILVNDSRGQQTPFSTFIGVKTGVLSIQLPNYAEIGEWNITLFGNNTLYSNFQVVAEENNWVEFAKNIFYDNEIFMIELKHDRKIEVVFYKDNVAYGRDWYLESGLLSSGIFDVPVDIALPEIGEWKVEIWQVNNFIKIQKLAEDTCNVIETPPEYEEIVVSDDITDYLQNIDPFYKGLIGIFIVLLCTFMPFIAIRKLGEHGVNFKVDIPPMLYTICCGVGGVVALILGVWQIEYTFFVCVMAGFGSFALYLMGKRNGE